MGERRLNHMPRELTAGLLVNGRALAALEHSSLRGNGSVRSLDQAERDRREGREKRTLIVGRC